MAVVLHGLDTVNKGDWRGLCGGLARVVAGQTSWGLMPAGYAISLSGTYRATANVGGGSAERLIAPDGGSSSVSAWSNDTDVATDIGVAVAVPDLAAYVCSVYFVDVTYNDASTIQVIDGGSVVATYTRNRYQSNAFWLRVAFRGGLAINLPKTSPQRNWFNCVFLDRYDSGSLEGGRFFHSL